MSARDEDNAAALAELQRKSSRLNALMLLIVIAAVVLLVALTAQAPA